MDLSDFHLVHNGKPCYILGAGPSLRSLTSDCFDNRITFAVNSAIAKYIEPTYFVSEDEGITHWSYYFEQLSSSSCIKFFNKSRFAKIYDKKCKKVLKEMINIVYFDQHVWDKGGQYAWDKVELHQNPTRPLTASRTSVCTAIHLAYLMGCKPIVLIGVDCSLVDGKLHYTDFSGEPKVSRLVKKIQWHKWEDEKIYNNMTRGNVQMLDFWKHFFKVTRNLQPPLEIIDCSNGKLTFFPQQKLTEVLETYGPKKAINTNFIVKRTGKPAKTTFRYTESTGQ